MKNPLQLLAELAGQYGIAAVFVAIFAGLFVYVMSRNYRQMIREPFSPQLLDGEKLLDRLDVTGLVTSSRTIATDRRVIHRSLWWLFSRRRAVAVAWSDVHSVRIRRTAGWLAVLVAAWLAGDANPVAFLLLLWGMDARIHTIVCETPFSFMPWTRATIRSFDRAALTEFTRFYQSVHEIWVRVRVAKEMPAGLREPLVSTAGDTDFSLGRGVWSAVLLAMAAAFAQRAVEGHVSFDSLIFGPIYLAMPIVAARGSRRDGLWVAFLSLVGLLTVKLPSTGLAGLLANDGGIPHFVQYGGILITLLAMSEASAWLVRSGRTALSGVAALLWIPYVALHMPTAAFDLGLLARSIAVAAVATVVVMAGERLAQRFPARVVGSVAG
jgi:hypothetical protein